VFNGMMALGSATWGFVASLIGIPLAFVLSALCLLAFDLVTVRWRIPGDDAVAQVAAGGPLRQSQGR